MNVTEVMGMNIVNEVLQMMTVSMSFRPSGKGLLSIESVRSEH